MSVKQHYRALLTYLLSFSFASFAFAGMMGDGHRVSDGHLLFEVGGYRSTQGKTQDIAIQGLIGDQYVVSEKHRTNVIFGLRSVPGEMRQILS
jgi:hypothetical protein